MADALVSARCTFDDVALGEVDVALLGQGRLHDRVALPLVLPEHQAVGGRDTRQPGPAQEQDLRDPVERAFSHWKERCRHTETLGFAQALLAEPLLAPLREAPLSCGEGVRVLAQQLLEKRLNKEGYHQSELTPGFWTHDWRPISFSLCVDDFGVKYVGEEHANHLMSVLKKDYSISSDTEGKRYIGLDLD